MNAVIWGVQIFLALFFLGAAFPKLTGRGLERWTGFSKLPRGLVLGIGTAEVLGSMGLVLPMATGILPWLTPLAAIGLAINVLMASNDLFNWHNLMVPLHEAQAALSRSTLRRSRRLFAREAERTRLSAR